MSEPDPLSVNVPLACLDDPATTTLPTSRLSHGEGRLDVGGGGGGGLPKDLVAHGVKSTLFPLAKTASPLPGPSPRGPDALPHQLLRASKNPTCRPATTTSPSRFVPVPLLKMLLAVMTKPVLSPAIALLSMRMAAQGLAVS